MTDDDLERTLRAALRPVDPEPGFTERVMSRIRGTQRPRVSSSRGSKARWASLALAASVVLTVLAVHQWQLHRAEQEGLAARAQLLDALRVTGEKLDIAYRTVNDSGA